MMDVPALVKRVNRNGGGSHSEFPGQNEADDTDSDIGKPPAGDENTTRRYPCAKPREEKSEPKQKEAEQNRASATSADQEPGTRTSSEA